MNGWKLVPIEPTGEMLSAAADVPDDWPQQHWEAMLAAAPVPPAGDVEVLGWLYADGTVLTHHQAPEVAEHIKDPNFNGGVDKVIKLSDHHAHVTRLTAERDGLLAVADRRKSDQEQMCSDIVALQSELTKARELLKSGSSPNYVHCEAVMAFLERGSPQ